MNPHDLLILFGGIITPLAILEIVFAATHTIFAILLMFALYYQGRKWYLHRTNPDRMLLEEIRREREGFTPSPASGILSVLRSREVNVYDKEVRSSR